MDKEYSTTKENCQEILDRIGGVCAGCGGKLIPVETVDNMDQPTFWGACMACEIFDWGTPARVFEIAQKLVKDHGHIAYNHLKKEEHRTPTFLKYWETSQIRGTCGIVSQVLKINAELQKEAVAS